MAARETGLARTVPLAALVLFGAMTGLGPFSMSVHLPGLPDMADDLRTSQPSIQLTMTACVVGIAMGQLIAGPISDAAGRRRPLLAAMALYAAASAGCALMWSVPALAALRCAQGIFAGFGMTIARAAIRDLAEGQHLVRLFARMAIISGLTPILAPNLGGALLAVTDWRGVFVVLALLGVVLAGASTVSIRESLPPARRVPLRPVATYRTYRTIAGDRSFLTAALIVGLAYGAMFSYVSSSSFVLTDAYGVSKTQFGLLFALNALGFMGGSQVGAALSARFGSLGALARSLPTATFGSVLIMVGAATHLAALVIAALWFTVASIGMCMPVASAEAMRSQSANAGTASGLLGLIQFALGGLVGPIAGAFGSASALPLGATMCVLLCAACVLCARSASGPRSTAATAATARPQ
ncbi:Bcr/CflA family drug resistance efflux transporter [Frankia sp. CcI49]|uniref:Bcr/CflA family efflux MFS transporter n=1 Tax=Frankia sp. CcI49 TaxID=1745382 RepID=UPI00097892DE|nr:Bcr/CflA family efflux MFS transporter [Frankia sp. CcI49]ONH51747.1 Bcr/CflA family drug resistance efflux transporter [Frankia sp. CcI49]